MPRPVSVKGAWSVPIMIQSFCITQFKINKLECTTPAFIIPHHMSSKLVLGTPFLKKYPQPLLDYIHTMETNQHTQIKTVSWRAIKKQVKNNTVDAYLCWVIMSDKPMENTTPTLIEERFGAEVVDKLPPINNTTSTIAHEIHLKPGSSPTFKRPY